MDINKFNEKKQDLELIEAFENFTLYYDRKEKTLWTWNGVDFIGQYAQGFHAELMKFV